MAELAGRDDVVRAIWSWTRAHLATSDGLAFARGLKDAGVVPVVKHFPGLGGATANTDVATADTKPWSVLLPPWP